MIDNVISGIVCHISQLPSFYSVIKHNGAVFDIKFLNKEVSEMVEKLQAYIDELRAKKAEVLAEDHNLEIDAKVAKFREDLIAEVEAHKAAVIAKIDSDIECISNIMDRECEVRVEEVKEVEGE